MTRLFHLVLVCAIVAVVVGITNTVWHTPQPPEGIELQLQFKEYSQEEWCTKYGGLVDDESCLVEPKYQLMWIANHHQPLVWIDTSGDDAVTAMLKQDRDRRKAWSRLIVEVADRLYDPSEQRVTITAPTYCFDLMERAMRAREETNYTPWDRRQQYSILTVPDTRTEEQHLADEENELEDRKDALKARREFEVKRRAAQKLWSDAKTQCWSKP